MHCAALAPLPFILILALLQLFITPAHEEMCCTSPGASWQSPHPEYMQLSCWCCASLGLILLLTLATAALSTLELIYGLDLLFKPLQKIGLNTRPITMVVQVMLRFIPSLLLSAERSRKHRLPGAAWGSASGGLLKRVRQFLPLILPLFSTSLQQADVLTQAMLARGYGSTAERTGCASIHSNGKTWAL